MATKQQDSQRKGQANQDHLQRSALIGKQVLHTLGQPGDLQKVQVRLLWEDHYRVNVLVGKDAATVTVAHSFFLVVDSAATVIACTPQITKHY